HHAIVYSIAHTLRPLGQFPEYFDYPGTAFDAANITGVWTHPSAADFLLYAAGLVYGPRGFLPANVPLYLLIPGVVLLFRRVRAVRPARWLALMLPPRVVLGCR